MTNYEHYREQIEKIARMGNKVAVMEGTNEITYCTAGICDYGCLFSKGGKCIENAMAWADAEYIEPEVDWSKVPVDTPILVSNDEENWFCRYFAEWFNGKVCAFACGSTSWSVEKNGTTLWKYAKLAEVNDGI